jgi:hypothetical protein
MSEERAIRETVRGNAHAPQAEVDGYGEFDDITAVW